MILTGKYNIAQVFTENIEQEAISQIINILNQEWTIGSKIAIMPDVHAGKGCTIGTTMTIKDKVVPAMVGVDIGCGMLVSKLVKKNVDLKKIDEFIHNYIPSGKSVREKNHFFTKDILNIQQLKSFKAINYDRALKSIGTLGGGNHFIELNKDGKDNLYLVIHSGSRQLGLQVCDFYSEIGLNKIKNNTLNKEKIINELKNSGREKEINKTLKELSLNKVAVSKEFAFVSGEDFDNYIYDMKITQQFASINRKAILFDILTALNLFSEEEFHTIHNYIDTEFMILRKGAISAKLNEKVLIPLNMRDGSIIAKGKGNSNWNFSGPHGAGRLMSRSNAKKTLKIEDYQETMKDVYTTCVNSSTLDEAPMVYKSKDEIIENIKDTVEILENLTPIYNFKASE